MNKGIGIVGYGKTGKGVLNFLAEKGFGEPVVIYDDNLKKKIDTQNFNSLADITVLKGPNEFDKLKTLGTIVLSPGINGRESRFDTLRNSNVEIVSEVEFASRYISNPIIAVTGSNGKSTTVSLIHHFLQHGGKKSVLCGNIGTPFISVISLIDADAVVVIEVSSFQLEEIKKFKPFVSVFLNITPDHLDRYPEFENYKTAKMNLLKNQTEDDYIIFNFNDSELQNFYLRNSEKILSNLLWFRGREFKPELNAYLKEGKIAIEINGTNELINLAFNPLIGDYNVENIMAAALAAAITGADIKAFSKSLSSFYGLPHRVEFCGSINNVNFVNDSKATNIDAALKAVSGIEGDIVIIVGGKDKGGDFTAFSDYIGKNVKKVLLIGEASKIIEDQLCAKKNFLKNIKSMYEGVLTGYSILKESGGTLLLSPGCASYDMYNNFEERGNDFKSAVNRFIGEMQNG